MRFSSSATGSSSGSGNSGGKSGGKSSKGKKNGSSGGTRSKPSNTTTTTNGSKQTKTQPQQQFIIPGMVDLFKDAASFTAGIGGAVAKNLSPEDYEYYLRTK